MIQIEETTQLQQAAINTMRQLAAGVQFQLERIGAEFDLKVDECLFWDITQNHSVLAKHCLLKRIESLYEKTGDKEMALATSNRMMKEFDLMAKPLTVLNATLLPHFKVVNNVVMADEDKILKLGTESSF